MQINYKNGLLILSLLLILCLSLTAVSADASISVDDVNSNVDVNDKNNNDNVKINDVNSVSKIGNFTELRDKISNSNNSLNLDKDYKYSTSEYKYGIIINKDNFVLDGKNHTIDGSNVAGVFDISAKKVTIKNINFINCRYDYGGAINSYSSDVCVSGCSFVGCSAKYGGAIFCEYGNSTSVSGCTFINSNAFHGGAIYMNDLNSTINNCNFVNCSANGDGDGGAIYCSNSTYSMKNCNFNNCSASYGGAICWDFTFINSVSGCSFVGCSASSRGGAIFGYGNNGTINNCTFINCSSSGGSAIYWRDDGSSTKINYNIFEGNKGINIYTDRSLNIDYNFFGFKNEVSSFPTGLIYGDTPKEWVVLSNPVLTGNSYAIKFVTNKGKDVTNFMPKYSKLKSNISSYTFKQNGVKFTISASDYVKLFKYNKTNLKESYDSEIGCYLPVNINIGTYDTNATKKLKVNVYKKVKKYKYVKKAVYKYKKVKKYKYKYKYCLAWYDRDFYGFGDTTYYTGKRPKGYTFVKYYTEYGSTWAKGYYVYKKKVAYYKKVRYIHHYKKVKKAYYKNVKVKTYYKTYKISAHIYRGPAFKNDPNSDDSTTGKYYVNYILKGWKYNWKSGKYTYKPARPSSLLGIRDGQGGYDTVLKF